MNTVGMPSADWVRRYLSLLGLEPAPPSFAFLSALTRSQVLSVPFENVTAILRRAGSQHESVPSLDLEALLSNWEQKRGGGVCFELAPMFGALLGCLGFRCTSVLGRISFPGSHQAVLVEIDGGRYLVDVSNGAPFFSPIPLNRTTEVRVAGLAFRFRPGESSDKWVQDRLIQNEWKPFCHYDLRPADGRTRERAYQGHHTPGLSWVVDRPRLIRCEENLVVSLAGNDLATFTPNGKTVQQLGDPADYQRVAADVFQLPRLPIAEALTASDQIAAALAAS